MVIIGIKNHQACFIAAFLIVSLHMLLLQAAPTSPPPPNFPADSFVIIGKVYCQSCKYVGTGFLGGAKVIVGAKVNVTCDFTIPIPHSQVVTTDSTGKFYAVENSLNFIDPTKSCRAVLLSSPDKKCDVPTNLNGGISGSVVTRDPSNGKFYNTSPFSFRSKTCCPSYCNAKY